MNIFNRKSKDLPRDARELLRENLNVLEMDKFYEKDPLLLMTKEERLIYLKVFADLYKNKELMERIAYMINKQAQKTLWDSRDGIQDIAGTMMINGMSSVIDEIKRLSKMHEKESYVPDYNPLDKFSIIPRSG